MKVKFHRTFTKRYKKAPRKVARQFDERLRIFEVDPSHPFSIVIRYPEAVKVNGVLT